jgi:hypothetical protein
MIVRCKTCGKGHPRQGPIDGYIKKILIKRYSNPNQYDVDTAYELFEAGICYEADVCICRDKKLEEYEVKEKEWLKTYQEMKDRSLASEVNDVIHKIRISDHAKKRMKVSK